MQRPDIIQTIEYAFHVTPGVALLGPRQCGKTTEAREYAQLKQMPRQNYFDLENHNDLQRLADPLLTLSALNGLIVIDEIQKIPELFPTLRVLMDDPNLTQQYLILGSASRQLIQQSSETLAGRINYLELTPFSFKETGTLKKIWLRGGFPLSYLAKDDPLSFAWRKSYIKTYLEQDIPQLGIKIPPENLRRFWMMIANSQGSVFNASDIGRSLGLTHKTIQHYADILTGTFMIRQLKPWFENIGKRQVKSPKIYIRDTGIFHALIGIELEENLLTHQKLGASWESFALEQIIQTLKVDPEDCYFWASHQGAELDLLILKDGKKIGFEIKYSSAPSLTKSMKSAQDALKLDSFTVIYPGDIDYPLTETIQVKGFENFISQNTDRAT